MEPRERAELLNQVMPDEGLSADEILDLIGERLLPHPMGNGHPRFFGWVNSAPAQLAVITEVLAAALNPSCAGGDHAAIYLERCVVRWLMELVEFPTPGGMGLLVSGGSMASLAGLTAARHWASREDEWDVRARGLQDNRARLVLYHSTEGHSCLRKSAEMLGLGHDSVRTIPVDARYRMDVRALEASIRHDRAEGLRPFCVVATAGTVNSGAVDPIGTIVDVARRESLWVHVDGAYGAVGIVDPLVRAHFEGLAFVDSLALDPHKWLAVPVECGCILVRDAALLRDTFSFVPPYLRTEEGKGFGGLPWYSEYGFQQTRGLRALKLWVTLAHAGRQGIARLISGHIGLARRLEALVSAFPDLELCASGPLSIVCFRYKPPRSSLSPEELDALNERICVAIQTRGRAFVTGTRLSSQYVLRACVLNHATTRDDVAALVAEVREVGASLAEGADPRARSER